MSQANEMQAMQDSLETFVDHFSMSNVIAMLEEIANLKADHVRTNWQDEQLAKTWDRMSKVLSRSYTHINKVDRMLP